MGRQPGRRPRASGGPGQVTRADSVIAEHLHQVRAEIARLEQFGALPPEARQQAEALLAQLERQLGAVQPSLPPASESDRPAAVQDAIQRLTTLLSGLSIAATPPEEAAAAPPDATPEASIEVPAHFVLPRPDGRGQTDEALEMPVNPAGTTAVRAIYAGRRRIGWHEDDAGTPAYLHESRLGRIAVSVNDAPLDGELEATAAEPAWTIVGRFTAETADVLLIILSRLGELPNPGEDKVRIRLDEIAATRGVSLREGSSTRLYQAFMGHVQALRRLRITMTWTDPRGGRKVTIGRPNPDRLLDILDIEVEQDGQVWHAFSCRAGQAIAYFMNENARWLGHYATALLRLDPHREERVKKVGTYWSLMGTISASHQRPPRASPATILEFIGEEPDWRNPGRTIRMFQDVHERLYEIGLCEDVPRFEPESRVPGYFEEWLARPVTFRLARPAPALTAAPSPAAALPPPDTSGSVPTAAAIQANPLLIREFRQRYHLGVQALGALLGIHHTTVTRYERQSRAVPMVIAEAIVALWQERAGAGTGQT